VESTGSGTDTEWLSSPALASPDAVQVFTQIWAYLNAGHTYTLLDETAGDWLTLNLSPDAPVLDLQSSVWQTAGAVPHVYFLGNSDGVYMLYQPDGVWLEATPVPASGSMAAFSAAYDPAKDFRIVNIVTNQRADWNVTYPVSWEANEITPPEIPVTLWLDAVETGHVFTFHSRACGGPERMVKVTAQAGPDVVTYPWMANGGQLAVPAGSCYVTGCVGYGMEFWLSRDADGAEPSSAGFPPIVHAGQGYAGHVADARRLSAAA
jgi:hypothetical protein